MERCSKLNDCSHENSPLEESTHGLIRQILGRLMVERDYQEMRLRC